MAQRVAAIPLLALSGLPAAEGLLSQAVVDRHFSANAGRESASWRRPEFFFGFSEGESTYNEDGDFGRPDSKYPDGWEPDRHNPYYKHIVSSAWLHESTSGGPLAAWQTHYPAGRSGIIGRGVTPGDWYQGRAGGWTQRYDAHHKFNMASDKGNIMNVLVGSDKISPGWFDVAAQQTDGFGRKKAPYPGTAARYPGWKERSVNTTVTCGEAGCTGLASLQAFNGNLERGRQCRLSIYAKPSHEVEWITVNEVTVSMGCHAVSGGCNESVTKAFVPCVRDLRLDKMIEPAGVLRIVAKTPDGWGACPFQGQLLYLVPMVSCLVDDQIGGPNHRPNPVTGGNATDPKSVSRNDLQGIQEEEEEGSSRDELQGGGTAPAAAASEENPVQRPVATLTY